MFSKISLWWKFEGRYYHKDFANGVKNLWKWFPVVWKDRDWDHSHILEVLKFKISKQADYISRRGIHINAKRDVEIMRTVCRLIERMQEDYYGLEYGDYHKTEYKFVPTDETKEWYTMESELISEKFGAYFAKYSRQYKRVMSGEIKKYTGTPSEKSKMNIALEIACENQERCNRLIFKILEENLQRWWD